jgi:hypothetical protein
MEAFPDQIFKRSDGIVIIDPTVPAPPEIVDSCPYGVIYYNEGLGIGQKCTFCAHLLDQGWEEPRCVEACPTKALVFGDLDDPEGELSQLLASKDVEVMKPELETDPVVFYDDLPRTFLAGTVVDARADELLVDVTVTLLDLAGGGVRQSTTNFMGDFEFEGLEAKRPYFLRVEVPGFYSRFRLVYLSSNIHIGDLRLFEKG